MECFLHCCYPVAYKIPKIMFHLYKHLKLYLPCFIISAILVFNLFCFSRAASNCPLFTSLIISNEISGQMLSVVIMKESNPAATALHSIESAPRKMLLPDLRQADPCSRSPLVYLIPRKFGMDCSAKSRNVGMCTGINFCIG